MHNETIREMAFGLLLEIKSVSLATVNNGKPASRIIDIMMIQDNVLYFITARGKPMYRQLKDQPYAALSGMNSNYSALRIEGPVTFMDDRAIVDKILKLNPAVKEIYGDHSDVLEVYIMKNGSGEIFDLSASEPKRHVFSFGGIPAARHTYLISDRCTACGLCLDSCPTNAIRSDSVYLIDSEKCLACGSCAESCPEEAIRL